MAKKKVNVDENKEEKELNEEVNKAENKSKKKIIIIIGAIVFSLIILGICGYFIYQEVKFREPIKEDWGQKYYVYLKEEKEVIPDEAENAKINFVETKEQEKPVMVVKYEKKKKTYANVYYIENNVVNTIIYNEPTNVELLYNIETEVYNYYLHIENETNDYYQPIDTQININKDQDNVVETEPEFKFEKKEPEKVTLENGEEKEVNDFDKQFVEVDTSNEYIDYDEDMSEKELKEAVESSIDEFTPQEEIIEEVSEDVNKQVEEMKEIKVLLEKLVIDDFYEKIKGYYCDKDDFYCVEIHTKKGKRYFNNFYYATEVGGESEILETKYKGNDIYELVLSKASIEVDIRKITNKTIYVDGDKLKYIARDIDTVGDVLLD